jgi:hypothetical protein
MSGQFSDDKLNFVLEKDDELVQVNELFIVHGNGKRAYSSKM